MGGDTKNFRWRTASLLKLTAAMAILLTTWALLGRLCGWHAIALSAAALSLFLGPLVLLTECRTPPSWRGTEHPQTDLSGTLIVCGTLLSLPGLTVAALLVIGLLWGGLSGFAAAWIRALAVVASSGLLVGAGVKLAHRRNAAFRQRVASEKVETPFL